MGKGAKISVNIDRLFVELELPDRIAAAAEAGFQGVEIPMPYDHPAPELRDKAIFAGIPLLRIDAPPPNYTGGAQGFAAQRACVERFRRDVARVTRQADVLGCRKIHLHTGLDEPGDAEILVENLQFAAALAPKTEFLVALLNPRDHGAHCMATADRAIRTIETVGRPNVRLLFSSWHANRHPEGLSKTWMRCAPHVGHVLLGGGYAMEADHRAQAMLELMKLTNYDGWACADYGPNKTTQQSLGWLTQ